MQKKSTFFLLLLVIPIGNLTTAALKAQESKDFSIYFSEPVFISLQKSGAVERLPDEKIFKGFTGAHYLSLGPDAETLIISGFKTGKVYIADARTGKKEATLNIGKVVQGVKIGPHGIHALAVNASNGSIAVIDLHENRIIKSVKVGNTPHNVQFSDDGQLAYVTVQGENKIAVVNMVTLKKVKEIPVRGVNGPHNLDINANGQRLWIRNHSSEPNLNGQVAIIDLSEGQTVNRIEVGKFHGGIDLVSSDSPIISSNIGGHTIDVIDPNKLTMIQTIDVGDGPHGMRYSPDGRWAYVTATRDNEVDIIDMKTLKIVERIKTKGAFPFWIALPGNK